MEELGRRVVPTRLPSQFLIHKRFQEMSQQSSICRERLGIGAEQCCGETRISEMQLRTFDQPLQSIAVPGREPFQQEKPLKECNVIPRLTAD